MLSRFGSVLEIEVSLDDWTHWALAADMPPELISFLRFRPELLHVFDGAKRANDMENFPCPRTWEYVGKILKMALPGDLEFAAIAGAVGEGAAFELRAFLTMLRSKPRLRKRTYMNEFLNDPVAMGAVIAAVLVNFIALGLKWQAATSKSNSQNKNQ